MSEKKVSFGRIFWPSLWSALIVSIIGVLIWVIAMAGLIGSFETEPLAVKDNTVLHMTLDGAIAEKGNSKFNATSFSIDNKMGLSAILHGFDVAEKDADVKGIFLEIDNLQCGAATAKEIRNAINHFEESGKFVVAYNSGEAVSTKEYYIASAANENYGFPTSNVQFLGLGAELTFFKKTLDNLEVEMQVVRGSDNHFKSAVEPFFRESMSDSSRLQMNRYVTSIWDDMKIDIGKDRKINPEELDRLAEEALIIDVTDAVKYNLIDAAKYRDEVIDIIAKKAGTPKDEKVNLFSFAKYAKKKFYQDQILMKEDSPNIAVILSEGGVAKSGDGLTSDEICKLFKEARENETIKTVVFRINSPGGSALASDEIWREVKLTNDKKKVIVSMGDVAASGGYFIAAPADYIFAEATTITGSIGVFGVIPFTGDMMENKLGLTFDRVATNEHSVLTSNRKLTETEFAMIQSSVDAIYTQFKSRVSEGRGMTMEEVGIIARGRVWTGRDALEIGLVDELGGIRDAIAYAAKQAGIKDQKVLYYPNVEEDKIGAFIELMEEKNASISLEKTELPSALVTYYKQLKQLEGLQGIQMRMPFDFILD